MTQAFIIDAKRSAVARRAGGLSGVHVADLAAATLRGLIDPLPLDPTAIDDVILGCCDMIGAQSADIARTAVLAAGLPETIPGVTIDRQCGSSQQAVHFAAQAVMSGTMDLVVAGGVQKMSQFPMMSSIEVGAAYGAPTPYAGCEGWEQRYGNQEISQFRGAELIAQRCGIERDEMEDFALESHRRAIDAIDSGWFDAEIVEIAGVKTDEGPRRDTSLERMQSLPTLTPNGRLTAAVSSQLADGASAVLVASERAVAVHGLRPRARVHQLTVVGDDPVEMLSAPAPATLRALDRAGMTIDQMDAIEINEAFAPVVIAWQQVVNADPKRVNPQGGAIALGHPIGATGTRLMTSMLNHLERTGGRFGLQVMCEGGGQANVTIIERL